MKGRFGNDSMMLRRPVCLCGKVSFNKKDAQTKRNHLIDKGIERYLRIYPCPQSNTWHLTKVPK